MNELWRCLYIPMDSESGASGTTTSDKGAAIAVYLFVGTWDGELGIGDLGGLREYLL